jgi:hypothetical protein
MFNGQRNLLLSASSSSQLVSGVHLGSATLPFVIPTRISYIATARNDHACDSPQREAHELYQRHHPQQEIRGSEAEGSAVQRAFRGNVFFDRAYPDFLHRNCEKGPRMRLSAKSRAGIAYPPRTKPSFGFVSGHDFSRAVEDQQRSGL